MKPTTTTAQLTSFCTAKIDGPDGWLWIDGNGKITAGNGTLEEPKPNAFSLLQIIDCPGATDVCSKLCYVHNLEKFAPETYELYKHNSDQLRRILDGFNMVCWARSMAEWISANCAGGFRWHVSGDIINGKYADFIALVCSLSPNVHHWIYTRSFFVAGKLSQTPNLTVNMSADSENYRHAKATAEDFGYKICYLTTDGIVPNDLPDGSVIFPDYSLRGGTNKGVEWFESLTPQYKSFVCPVDYHGKSENRRCGPCNRCLK